MKKLGVSKNYQEISRAGEESQVWGGYRPGAGRPLGSPNKISREIRDTLACLDQPALDRLGTLIESEDEAIAIRAVELCLAYLHGKPRQSVRVEAHRIHGVFTPQELDDLPPGVLRKLLSGQHITAEDLKGVPYGVICRLARREEDLEVEGQNLMIEERSGPAVEER